VIVSCQQNVKVSALKVLNLKQITTSKTACMGIAKCSEMRTASYTDRYSAFSKSETSKLFDNFVELVT
jgi:dissimilatory sulfite reductase (desulfoviridin) alpha/beta subunit